MHRFLMGIETKPERKPDEPTAKSSCNRTYNELKSHKYDELHLPFGFMSVTINSEEQPQLCFVSQYLRS
jgi:hypothetical protein